MVLSPVPDKRLTGEGEADRDGVPPSPTLPLKGGERVPRVSGASWTMVCELGIGAQTGPRGGKLDVGATSWTKRAKVLAGNATQLSSPLRGRVGEGGKQQEPLGFCPFAQVLFRGGKRMIAASHTPLPVPPPQGGRGLGLDRRASLPYGVAAGTRQSVCQFRKTVPSSSPPPLWGRDRERGKPLKTWTVPCSRWVPDRRGRGG